MKKKWFLVFTNLQMKNDEPVIFSFCIAELFSKNGDFPQYLFANKVFAKGVLELGIRLDWVLEQLDIVIKEVFQQVDTKKRMQAGIRISKGQQFAIND